MEEERIEERWKEYFSELLNVEDDDSETPMYEEEDQQIDEVDIYQPITTEEVKTAIRRIKNGKSPGIDGLHNEFFKTGDTVQRWLTDIFNKAWEEERVPNEWRRAIICPIHKKGDKKRCQNYRGISLLTSASKIYERVLERRLRSAVEDCLGEWQYGFRPNRSTMDLVFSLKMIVEKTIEYDSRMYIAFIDLEKAFDRIPRERLWKTLYQRRYAISSKLLRVLKGL